MDCSYDGRILPHVMDDIFRNTGDQTRVLTGDLHISFSKLMVKLSKLCSSSVTLRYPLPNGNLEALISFTSNEDLANIIEEYDRASSSLTHPLKIRAILTPANELSPPQSFSSNATHFSSRSTHSSDESLPYSVAHQNCLPIGYPIGVGNRSVKGCWYVGKFDRSPRFLYP